MSAGYPYDIINCDYYRPVRAVRDGDSSVSVSNLFVALTVRRGAAAIETRVARGAGGIPGIAVCSISTRRSTSEIWAPARSARQAKPGARVARSDTLVGL